MATRLQRGRSTGDPRQLCCGWYSGKTVSSLYCRCSSVCFPGCRLCAFVLPLAGAVFICWGGLSRSSSGDGPAVRGPVADGAGGESRGLPAARGRDLGARRNGALPRVRRRLGLGPETYSLLPCNIFSCKRLLGFGNLISLHSSTSGRVVPGYGKGSPNLTWTSRSEAAVADPCHAMHCWLLSM